MKKSIKRIICALLTFSMIMGLTFTGMSEETDLPVVSQLTGDHLFMTIEEVSPDTLSLTIHTKAFKTKDLINDMLLMYDNECYTCESRDFRLYSIFSSISARNVSQKYGAIWFSYAYHGNFVSQNGEVLATVTFHKNKTVEDSVFRLYYDFEDNDGVREPALTYLACTLPYSDNGSGTTPTPGQSADPAMPGDVNKDGSIKVDDALIILKIVVGAYKPSEEEKLLADVDNVTGITVSDALCVLRKVVISDYKFPYEQ